MTRSVSFDSKYANSIYSPNPSTSTFLVSPFHLQILVLYNLFLPKGKYLGLMPFLYFQNIAKMREEKRQDLSFSGQLTCTCSKSTIETLEKITI